MTRLDDLMQSRPSPPAAAGSWADLEPFGEPARTSLETVQITLAVLEAVGSRGRAYGAAELARRAGLPRSTAERVLAVLSAAGLVQWSAEGYRLGARLQTLAAAA